MCGPAGTEQYGTDTDRVADDPGQTKSDMRCIETGRNQQVRRPLQAGIREQLLPVIFIKRHFRGHFPLNFQFGRFLVQDIQCFL